MTWSDAMWLGGTARRRVIAWTIGGLLVLLSACRLPQVAPQSVPHAARLPEPGVYVLRRAKGLPLPADLKPQGAYDSYERVLAGWLYLTPDSIYHTIICADLVGSTDKGPNTMDRQSEGRYWAAGGRVYFSDPVTDAMPDSIAVRVQGDTIEFALNLYVRDQKSSLTAAFSRGPPLPEYVCAPVRASSK